MLRESRVRKNLSASLNVMSNFCKLVEENLVPCGWKLNCMDSSWVRYDFEKDWWVDCKCNFEIDNSFPSFERYQMVYYKDGEEVLWVGGNIKEMVNDFSDLLNIFEKDLR